MVTNKNKIIAAMLVVAIIVALGVFIYVNLPKQTTPTNETPQPGTSILTVTVNGHQTNYTLAQLESLDSFTAKGGYRTSFPAIKGQGNYTGVRIQSLISSLSGVPNNYSIVVFSSDGSNRTFNHSMILGGVDTYDPMNASDASPIGHGGLTMVLAYKYEGEYFNISKDGRLKIVFLNDQGSISSSGLWWKYVEAIQVTSERAIS
jgi:hypothetical protein